MTKEEILKSEDEIIRIVFTKIDEAEHIIKILEKEKVGFRGNPGSLNTMERDGIINYLNYEPVYFTICKGSMIYCRTSYEPHGKIDISYNEFLTIFEEVTKNISNNSPNFCSCAKPTLTKNIVLNEWFNFCTICKKERK